MPRIAVCADDFALSPGVSDGIAQLAEAGRITAAGCITIFPWWGEQARRLRPLTEVIDIGLHLTLTDHAPLAPMPVLAPSGRLPRLGRLIRAGLAGAIDRAELRAEIERQIDAFEAALGRPPTFLDGHHHVHQLPGLRDVVIDVFAARLAPAGAFMRSCWDSPARIIDRRVHALRALAIALPGRRLLTLANHRGICCNRGFSGVHDFSGKVDYGILFRGFLRRQRDGGLIMCHPGLLDRDLASLDSLVERREDEYRWLAGDDMGTALAEAGVELCRLSQMLDQRPHAADNSHPAMEDVAPHDNEVDDQAGPVSD